MFHIVGGSSIDPNSGKMHDMDGHFERMKLSLVYRVDPKWETVSKSHVEYLLDRYLIYRADEFEEEMGEYSIEKLLESMCAGRTLSGIWGLLRFVKD
jgi:hypothetical protein